MTSLLIFFCGYAAGIASLMLLALCATARDQSYDYQSPDAPENEVDNFEKRHR